MAGEGHAERSHMLEIRDIGLLRRGDEDFAVTDLKALIVKMIGRDAFSGSRLRIYIAKNNLCSTNTPRRCRIRIRYITDARSIRMRRVLV